MQKSFNTVFSFERDMTLNLQTRQDGGNVVYFEWGMFRIIPEVIDPDTGLIITERQEVMLEEYEVPSLTSVKFEYEQETTGIKYLMSTFPVRGTYRSGPFDYYGRMIYVTAANVPVDHFVKVTVYMGEK